jgi:hypothetical protein
VARERPNLLWSSIGEDDGGSGIAAQRGNAFGDLEAPHQAKWTFLGAQEFVILLSPFLDFRDVGLVGSAARAGRQNQESQATHGYTPRHAI